MFGHQLYPTPVAVIEKMLEPYKGKYHRGGINGYMHDGYKLQGKRILEPSAGKGDILDYITGRTVLRIEKDYYRPGYDYEHTSADSTTSKNCYCLELDINLQTILEEKGYNFLGNDFLSFTNQQQYWFDLILMNPPFDTGAKHLLHAWDILKTGDIVCLLNAETINNPHSAERTLLANIIKDHNGNVEILGPVFSDAENPTDVNVALVRLSKETKSDFDFEFETKGFESLDLDEEELLTALKKPDLIADMQLRYREILDNYKLAYKAVKLFRHHTSMILNEHYEIKFTAPQDEFETLSRDINSKLWYTIISKINMDKFMTHSVRENFSKFIQQKGLLEFNHKNVQDLISMLFENKYTILERAIVEVFDMFTQYHSENRCHVEGWKTNDSWKVNRKVILPNWITYGGYMNAHDIKQYGDKMKINYGKQSSFSDIDKVMCYITGKDYNNLRGGLYVALENKLRIIGNIKTGDKFDSEFESQFFNCKIYRKGTLHITFKDESLWREFNMRSCAGKNWLPPGEKKAWEDSKKPKEEIQVKAIVPQLAAPVESKQVQTFARTLFD